MQIEDCTCTHGIGSSTFEVQAGSSTFEVQAFCVAVVEFALFLFLVEFALPAVDLSFKCMHCFKPTCTHGPEHLEISGIKA